MTSRTRGSERFRCGVTACRARFRHKKRLKRDPKCPECGDTLHVRSIEAERLRELSKQDTCCCGQYPFPHREGTLRMCLYHPLANVDPTDEEIYDYRSILDTQRSGFC